MSKPVVIFGLTDFARIARIYLEHDSPHDVVAYTVDQAYRDRDELGGLPVVAWEQLRDTHPPDEFDLLVATGFKRVNQVRAEIFARVKEAGYDCITYVHSSVARWPTTTFGENTFVFEENVVQPNVTVGDDTILWSGNHVGHDGRIGNHCFIASHAVVSGNVTIGDYCFIGVNATFRDGVAVAPRTVVGAGALIMKDTVEGGVYSVRGTPPHEVRSWDLPSF
jgi:sugar O-acyltransferase (sialic acid O-acetyltransferase NeuD family)